MKILSILSSGLILGMVAMGCSTAYILKPVTQNEAVNENCILQASLFEANDEETLFKVSITSKSDTAFDVSPTSFSIQSVAQTLSASPVSATDPQTHLKKLSAQAELYEARANTTNWLGMDALTGSEEYKKLRSEHQSVENDRKNNLKAAEKTRQKIARINGRTLEKKSLEAGKSVEGILIFPARIQNDGPLTLDSQNPLCTVSIAFEAD